MVTLPNGCHCSELTVNPKNWDKPGASLTDPWYIQYYFYDPVNGAEKYKYGKLVIVKRMNRFKKRSERVFITKKLIEAELNLLQLQGYNPITERFMVPLATPGEIDPTTPFIAALNQVKEKVKVSHNTKIDIKSAVKYIELSAINLEYDRIPIGDIKRKHLRLILDNCRRVKKYWSSHLFNHYRTYLIILFNELLELEAVDSNPVLAIKKEGITEKLRETMTPTQRTDIDKHFAATDPYFHRFLRVFFHSGARPVELLRLTAADVNIDQQVYKVIVRKGRKSREEERPIIDSVLPLWKNIMQEISLISAAGPKIFLFGKFLKPSMQSSSRDYVSKKFKREAKKKLGITADMYSLKHSNLDEVAAELTLNDASGMAGHSTPVITMTYAKGEKERQNDRLKKVTNKFAG